MGRRKPALVIVGGINGCGKTTFARMAGPDLFLGQTAINPDDLTREVVSKFPNLRGDGANLVGVERAEKAAWRAIAEGNDVAIETVLSSTKFLPLAQGARFRKYRTRLIYVGLPTENGQLQPVLVAERIGRAASIKLYDPSALPEVTRRLRLPPG